MVFHLIPHTHWDREWFLPRAAFQARLVPVLDEVIDQLEHDPQARFLLDGQTILLEDYLTFRPDRESRIAALVQRGALEIGPWYVLSDLLVPSLASLRRNLAEGSRDAARFGRRLDVLYSPDAFGHPAVLPALAAEYGIRRAVIRRGLGRPWDLYRWTGSDNASVLVHHLPRGGYDVAIDLVDAGARLEQVWAPIRRDLMKHAVTDQVAVFLGADHHAMVPEVSALRARLQELEPNHQVRVSGLTEYFEAVEACDAEIPEVQGELRRGGGHTWILQDVHSARSRIKRQHASAELTLAGVADPLARLARQHHRVDREGLVRHAWRTLLQSQFHDTLAGTTSDEAQREQMVRLESVATLSREIIRASLNDLILHDADLGRTHPEQVSPTLVLWNAAQEPRAGVVTAEVSFFVRDVLVGPPTGRIPAAGPGHFPMALRTQTNEMIPVQVIGIRRAEERLDAMRHYPDQDAVDIVTIAFRVPAIPAQQCLLLVPVPSEIVLPATGLEARPELLANAFTAVRVSPSGVLAITDRLTGEEYDGLCEITIESDDGDLYTFSPQPGTAPVVVTPVSQELTAAGPLCGTIATHWVARTDHIGTLSIHQQVTLLADSALVRIGLDIRSSVRNARVRLRFPGGGTHLVTGSAGGIELRAVTHHQPSADAVEHEVTTVPAHRFMASAVGSRGMLVATPGFFEAELQSDGTMSLTLFRAIGQLSRNDLVERPGHAAWPVETPDGQEHGVHRIELVLQSVDAGIAGQTEELERLAETVTNPIKAHFVRDYTARRTRPVVDRL